MSLHWNCAKNTKHSDIQYTSVTPDKMLNSLVYRTLFYVNIYGSFKLSKNSPFFGPPCTYISYSQARSFKIRMTEVWRKIGIVHYLYHKLCTVWERVDSRYISRMCDVMSSVGSVMRAQQLLRYTHGLRSHCAATDETAASRTCGYRIKTSTRAGASACHGVFVERLLRRTTAIKT